MKSRRILVAGVPVVLWTRLLTTAATRAAAAATTTTAARPGAATTKRQNCQRRLLFGIRGGGCGGTSLSSSSASNSIDISSIQVPSAVSFDQQQSAGGATTTPRSFSSQSGDYDLPRGGGGGDMKEDKENNNDNDESDSGDSSSDKCIYLDYNGTTPILQAVLLAMMPFLTTHFGNPSSSHAYGKQPKLAIQEARRSILKLLGQFPPASTTAPKEWYDENSIWFTGCGTESDNLAIQLGILSSTLKEKKPHIVTSNVEHPAIEEYLIALQAQGVIEVTFVPVQQDGRVKAQDMINAIQDNTCLVTLMLANNESGAIQPVREVSRYCRQHNILMHTDAAQACGKISTNLSKDMGDPDMVTVVGHKIGAPKGVAALYVRPNCLKLPPAFASRKSGILLMGGGQEHGRRAGTENVPYIVGFGEAAELAVENLQQNASHMETMRQRLLDNLILHLGEDNVRPNGPLDPADRLPNTLSVGLRGVNSGEVLEALQNQVAASAGAACHSTGTGSISSVLRAMKVPIEFATGTVRLSVGPTTTPHDVDQAAKLIAKEVLKRKKQ